MQAAIFDVSNIIIVRIYSITEIFWLKCAVTVCSNKKESYSFRLKISPKDSH